MSKEKMSPAELPSNSLNGAEKREARKELIRSRASQQVFLKMSLKLEKSSSKSGVKPQSTSGDGNSYEKRDQCKCRLQRRT